MLPRAGMSAGPIHSGGWVPGVLALHSGSGLALGCAWRVLLPERSWKAPLRGSLGPSLRAALGCDECVCAQARMCQIVRTRDFHLDTFQTPYVLVAQSCLTLGDPMDCNPPGSSVHGILQARILEWVAMPFARGSFRPRDQTRSPASQASSLPPCHLGSPF